MIKRIVAGKSQTQVPSSSHKGQHDAGCSFSHADPHLWTAPSQLLTALKLHVENCTPVCAASPNVTSRVPFMLVPALEGPDILAGYGFFPGLHIQSEYV